MTTAEATAAVSQEEAVEKLLARGYMRAPCAECKGVGHHTHIPADGLDWRRWACAICDGHGWRWTAPPK